MEYSLWTFNFLSLEWSTTMHKKFARTGSMLNKNLTDTETLTLTELSVNGRTHASAAKINSLGVENMVASCATLDFPTK